MELVGGLLQVPPLGPGYHRAEAKPTAHLRSITFDKALAAQRPLRLRCTLELKPRAAAGGLPASGSKRKADAAGLALHRERARAEAERYWDRARAPPPAVTVRYCSSDGKHQAKQAVPAFRCPIKSCSLRCASFTVRAPLGGGDEACRRPLSAHAARRP